MRDRTGSVGRLGPASSGQSNLKVEEGTDMKKVIAILAAVLMLLAAPVMSQPNVRLIAGAGEMDTHT